MASSFSPLLPPPGLERLERPSSWPVRNKRRHYAVSSFNDGVNASLAELLDRSNQHVAVQSTLHSMIMAVSEKLDTLLDKFSRCRETSSFRDEKIQALKKRVEGMELLLFRTSLADFPIIDQRIAETTALGSSTRECAKDQMEPESETSPIKPTSAHHCGSMVPIQLEGHGRSHASQEDHVTRQLVFPDDHLQGCCWEQIPEEAWIRIYVKFADKGSSKEESEGNQGYHLEELSPNAAQISHIAESVDDIVSHHEVMGESPVADHINSTTDFVIARVMRHQEERMDEMCDRLRASLLLAASSTHNA